jgi:2-iminobutanoate/2-iminopropanoate deaminase
MKNQLLVVILGLISVCGFAQQREVVSANDAPKAIGPYSHAIKANGFVFVSGQLPIDPATGQLSGSDTAAQADRVLKNLEITLKAAGVSLGDVVKNTVYLKNMADFSAMNEVYGRYFKGAPPARATVEVKNLPKDALIEIESVAVIPGKH